MEQQIISAIIAGVAALTGVMLSRIFSLIEKAVETKREKAVFLREKFEQMAIYFLKSEQWFVDINNANSSEELHRLTHSDDAVHALILCNLYFPELSETVSQYSYAMVLWYKHAVDCYYSAGQVGNVGYIALRNPQHEILIRDILQKKEAAVNLISSKATLYSR